LDSSKVAGSHCTCDYDTILTGRKALEKALHAIPNSLFLAKVLKAKN
jgi:hypothetical protein